MNIDGKKIQTATGLKVFAVPACVSTFDEIGENDVIVAGTQKRGSGRGANTFYSPKGGLYIVMRVSGLNIDPHTLTPSVGIAVHDAIKAVLKIDTELKWVNDVMLNGKKVAGILVRSPRRGEYLVGVGINYATDQKLLDEAGLDAVTLNAPEELAVDFCINLLQRIHVNSLAFDKERYTSLCRTVGKTVSFTQRGVPVKGYAEGIEADGSLIVRIGVATVTLDSGEVFELREV